MFGNRDHYKRKKFMLAILKVCINNNYSPKWRWLVVNIYLTASQFGKYSGLATSTSVNNCYIFDPETIPRNRPKYVAAFPTILTMIVDTGLRATDS